MQTVQVVGLMNNIMATGLNYGFFYEFDAISVYVYVLYAFVQKFMARL